MHFEPGKRVKLPRYMGSREGTVANHPLIGMVETEYTPVQLALAAPRRISSASEVKGTKARYGIVYVLTEHLELVRLHSSCATCTCVEDPELDEDEDEDDI
jgi:hypothetical protein